MAGRIHIKRALFAPSSVNLPAGTIRPVWRTTLQPSKGEGPGGRGTFGEKPSALPAPSPSPPPGGPPPLLPPPPPPRRPEVPAFTPSPDFPPVFAEGGKKTAGHTGAKRKPPGKEFRKTNPPPPPPRPTPPPPPPTRAPAPPGPGFRPPPPNTPKPPPLPPLPPAAPPPRPKPGNEDEVVFTAGTGHSGSGRMHSSIEA